ncbi:MAG: hypothetical protein HYY05_07030, partial [Chloroflexi bacterium]|nr:hypothetical protein [Chloroflexota bacterium]
MSETGSEASPVALPPLGVIACYGHAWRQLWRHFPLLFLVLAAGFLIQLIPGLFLGAFSGLARGLAENLQDIAVFLLLVSVGLDMVSGAYGIFVGWPLSYGMLFVCLRAARDTPPQFPDLFLPFTRAYLPTLAASFVSGLLVGIPIAMLAVPGVIVIVLGAGIVAASIVAEGGVGFAAVGALVIGVGALLVFAAFLVGWCLWVRVSLTPYLVIDEALGPIAAISESWNRTKGYFWRLLAASLLGSLVAFAGLFVFLVGVIPALMWAAVAYASLFAAITAERGAGPPAAFRT